MELNVKSLLSTGRLSPRDVHRALKAHAREGGPVLRHLQQAAGFSDEDLCDVIAQASNLRRAEPEDLEAAAPEALRLVAGELCRHTCAIPVRLDGETLIVAMADPFDEAARHELEFAAGHRVEVELATEGAVRHAIGLHYPPAVPDDVHFLCEDDDLRELFCAALTDGSEILEVLDFPDEQKRRRRRATSHSRRTN